MIDAFTWTHVGIAISALGLVAAAWKIRQADRQDTDEAIANVARELGEFKLHVALMHPTTPELANLRTDVMGAINRLTDRIDRLLEQRDG